MALSWDLAMKVRLPARNSRKVARVVENACKGSAGDRMRLPRSLPTAQREIARSALAGRLCLARTSTRAPGKITRSQANRLAWRHPRNLREGAGRRCWQAGAECATGAAIA